MTIKAYAKTSLRGNSGFVFTGVQKTGIWEVDVAPAGAKIHGITLNDMDSMTPRDVQVMGYGPIYIRISETILANETLTPNNVGGFKKPGAGDAVVGVAIKGGRMGSSCIGLLYGN